MFNKIKYLLTYRYAEIIHDLTVEFCQKYIDYRSRTKDQMEQAARSGKQNIVEGVAQSPTSKKGEIKLLGVANASFEELLSDYEDYLRQHQLTIYPKTHPKITQFRQLSFNLGNLKIKPQLPGNPTDDANFLLTLCHQETYLLTRQIESTKTKFIQEGGLTENLYHQRLEYKNQHGQF